MDGIGHFFENVEGAEIVNAVNGIQSQGIDMILGDPIQGIVNDKATNVVTVWTVIINGGTPRRSISMGKVGTEILEIVAFRPHMVVDDVQDHGEAGLMACIDQFFQALGS